MAKVPYTPYSEVTPSTQNINVPASPEAFGVGTARAAGGLGESIDRAGDKLFQRAMAFQDLDNHAENDNLQSGYTKEADLERIRFQSLEGNNAKEDLINHQETLDKIRENWSQKASNPMVRKMFDSGSKPLNVRIQGAAATHTAAEFKKYQTITAQAKVSAAEDQVAMFPNDDVMFKSSMQKVEATIYEQASIHGWSVEVAEQNFLEARSRLTAKRIDSLSKKDPRAAQEMFDEYSANGFLHGGDLGPTGDKVEQKMVTTQSKIDADAQVSGGNLRLGNGKVSDAQASIAIAGVETGGEKGDPYKVKGVMTKHGRALGKYQVMEEFLPEFLREAGMPSMSGEEFLNDPKAQEQLFKARFRALQEKYGSFNEAARRWIGTGAHDALGTTPQRYIEKANGWLAKNATLADHRANGEQMAEGKNPLYKVALDDAIITRFSKNQAEKRDTDYRTKDTLLGLASGINMPNGEKPTSVEQMTAVPEGEIAWDRADNTLKAFILNRVLPHNAKGDHAFTNETYKEYAKLVGLANSDDPKDRAAFLEQPPEAFMDKPWPFSKRDAIINLQRKMKNTTEGNPHVNQFLAVNAGQMNGIVDKKVDKDDWYQFVGIAHDRILAAQAAKPGQPLKDEDYLKIGKDMLYQKMEKGWFGKDVPSEPAYRMKPSPEEAERIKKLPEWGGKVPSDYWVNRYYQQQILTPAKEEKAGTKEPTKTVPPSITDRLVGAIDAASAKMKEGREREAATEEDIRKQQENILIQRSLARTKTPSP